MTVSSSALLRSKLLVAFVLGVAAYGIPRILDALDAVNATGNYNVGRSIVISFLAGCVSAGIRYVLAVSPINLTPTDKLHQAGASGPRSVTVTKG